LQRLKISATQGLTRIDILAPGKVFLMAATAGNVITASPIQFVPRIRMFFAPLKGIFFEILTFIY
jgi:hypothetical protein